MSFTMLGCSRKDFDRYLCHALCLPSRRISTFSLDYLVRPCVNKKIQTKILLGIGYFIIATENGLKLESLGVK
jgi:hypothetical protein